MNDTISRRLADNTYRKKCQRLRFILGRFSRLVHGLGNRTNIYHTSRNSKVMDFMLKTLKTFCFQKKIATRFCKSLLNESYLPDLKNFFEAIEFNVFHIIMAMIRDEDTKGWLKNDCAKSELHADAWSQLGNTTNGKTMVSRRLYICKYLC